MPSRQSTLTPPPTGTAKSTYSKQTAEATEDIRRRVQGIQQSTGETVESITAITNVMQDFTAVSETTAAAVEEQSVTAKEIAQGLSQTSEAAITISTGVTESASTTHEIAQTISGVDHATKETDRGAGETQAASQ